MSKVRLPFNGESTPLGSVDCLNEHHLQLLNKLSSVFEECNEKIVSEDQDDCSRVKTKVPSSIKKYSSQQYQRQKMEYSNT